MQTGYFANQNRSTKVHLVENGKAICGSKMSQDAEFHWCSRTAHLSYVNCEKCRKAYIALEETRLEALKKSVNRWEEFA